MALFPALAIPVWYLLVISFYRTPSRGWRGVVVPYIGGLAVGAVCLALTLSLLTRIPFRMTPAGLYFWALIRGPGWPLPVGFAVVVVLNTGKSTSFSRIRDITGWLSGVSSMYTFWYALTPDPGFEAYRVFFIPVLFIAATALAGWVTDRGLRNDGWLSIVLIVSGGLVSPVLTVLPALLASGRVLVPTIITGLIAAGATLLIYLDSRGRFA